MNWILGAAVAVVLVGGGYFAWKTFTPGHDRVETAYNDTYGPEPLPADAMAPEQDAAPYDAGAADDPAQPADTIESRAPVPRANVHASAVPEATIGITPVSASADETMAVGDNDDIVVRAPRRPIWVRTPSPRRLSALYPERALDRGREGEARLHCIIGTGGTLDCERVSETPGFGSAAVRVAHTFRHAETLADGSSAIGTPVNLRVIFRIDDDPRSNWRRG